MTTYLKTQGQLVRVGQSRHCKQQKFTSEVGRVPSSETKGQLGLDKETPAKIKDTEVYK